MGITIQKFTFNPFQENTIVLHDSKNCVIIDPGCYEPHEEQAILKYIEENDLTPIALLLTHAHVDHILGCNFILNTYDIDFYMHHEDLPTLNAVVEYAAAYGFVNYKVPKTPNKLLNGGERLQFGEINLDVLFTPGHCLGHVVYYDKENGYVINGDVLFDGSFGRVDLPGGDINVLKNSIFNTMFKLPDETIVYCGHGPETTIGKEKQSNMIHHY